MGVLVLRKDNGSDVINQLSEKGKMIFTIKIYVRQSNERDPVKG